MGKFNIKQKTSTWLSPAKLNLYLQIIGQRDDGYHLLQSVFQMVDLFDEIRITPGKNKEIRFSCNLAELNNHDNLIIKACELLTHYAETNNAPYFGLNIELNKKIPMGAGLGGGSSNCATTLMAINQLWQLNLDSEELIKMGVTLGADVPFFIFGKTAFVEGVGEKLTPFSLPSAWFLIIKPDCHISTGKIFSHPLLTRNNKAITIRDLDTLGLPFQGVNSLETVVVSEYDEVNQALDWLKKHQSNARLTGTGACVFAVFDNEREIRKIAAQCPWQSFVARGLENSPIQNKLTS
ncbi:MAG: 4-(cytidine 5'-diphospho)-2-C-methyl-D-erythritol kinase [Gammaproteobacteria bacterium]|nr:4-(cytidine 5'-diphospho)-2-C-methyl-D-erythritol kinase [Gammaproteobacteria bacterium]MDH5629360.1 4-(cytidine 5'-diphospho)-2-C-methyl-D-erythritol kinase [Gammaproteobacteria bacterium]